MSQILLAIITAASMAAFLRSQAKSRELQRETTERELALRERQIKGELAASRLTERKMMEATQQRIAEAMGMQRTQRNQQLGADLLQSSLMDAQQRQDLLSSAVREAIGTIPGPEGGEAELRASLLPLLRR